MQKPAMYLLPGDVIEEGQGHPLTVDSVDHVGTFVCVTFVGRSKTAVRLPAGVLVNVASRWMN